MCAHYRPRFKLDDYFAKLQADERFTGIGTSLSITAFDLA